MFKAHEKRSFTRILCEHFGNFQKVFFKGEHCNQHCRKVIVESINQGQNDGTSQFAHLHHFDATQSGQATFLAAIWPVLVSCKETSNVCKNE